jgi:hypothetical protein
MMNFGPGWDWKEFRSRSKPTGMENNNNKVNRRLAGGRLNASVAADGDETERQYG